MHFKRVLFAFIYAIVCMLFLLSNNGITAEYPEYIPPLPSFQETEYRPVQRDAQFEYELLLVAEKLQQDNSAEDLEYRSEEKDKETTSLSASQNFMADYNQDGTLRNIEVRDEHGVVVERYEIRQNPNTSFLTLLRSDASIILLFLDTYTLTAKIVRLKAAQGVNDKQLITQLTPVISFMGYRLEDGVVNNS
jgi:hypothetical protein